MVSSLSQWQVLASSQVKVKVGQFFQLFATPWTIQFMEFSRPEYCSGWPIPSLEDLPDPGIKPGSAALQADSFPAELHGKPHHCRWLDLKQANPHLTPHRPTQSSLSSDDVTPFLSQLGLCTRTSSEHKEHVI